MVDKVKTTGACPIGTEIDEYLHGTICEAPEEIAKELTKAPDDADYKVTEKEAPQEDDRYKDFL